MEYFSLSKINKYRSKESEKGNKMFYKNDWVPYPTINVLLFSLT